MTIAFDTTRATWFNETTNAELRGWKGSEHELVARACRLSGFTPDRIVHQGVQLLAQRLIATALSDAHLTVTRGGVRGAADERLAAGYKALKSAGLADAGHHRLTPGLRLHPPRSITARRRPGSPIAGCSRRARQRARPAP